ncbi:hypothetical protein BAUCODRAFT_217966 [Baudoinia panamericana UAMH 10762]|uniref:Purine-cytosine permease n=1 Tax=Baudoinia panamericana (strain UAMH 10762) TaxID=717646 RepID=M2N5I5_BAUPA|nr:uncharacterized protein BAUCODRAFT_217966 [Baudoinia panamericana UAMH 10762]EMC94005.1 hypothetical protein BAUCODRAFT_217966 [Baudoinia panamericana UAMH 10762]
MVRQGASVRDDDVEESASPDRLSLPHNADHSSAPRRWNRRIESLIGFEARGLERVSPEERQAPSGTNVLQMLLLWFSANLTVNNLAIGLLGPLVFKLGFSDSAWCAVVGVLCGSASTAYMSTWGAVSGNRTMVVLRYFFGYYPAKICTLLNIVLMVGWATIDSITGGQVLSAVSGGSMSIAVGVVIVTVIECAIAVFGMKIFQTYERFAWLPQVIMLFILVGSAGPNFNTSLTSSVTGSALAANRFTFLTTCFYVPNSWAAAGSDYYVYYPENTPRWMIFLLTLGGLSLSFCFMDLLGVGLGSGVTVLSAWSDAYTTSSGALIATGYAPLRDFGRFCAAIIALGVISNCTPSIYSGAIDCQIMGRYGQMIPRWIWVLVLVGIQLVCALVGRNHLFTIFQNFLALMGYWLLPMICIVLEEESLFKRRVTPDWEA